MSKLFIGAEAIVPEAAYTHALVSEADRQKNPHLTFMYCGKEVTDEDMEKLVPCWENMIASLRPEQLQVTITGDYALFGKENNVLVLKCAVDPAFEDAVNAARDCSRQLVPSLPDSDFPFSAHVTLGDAHTLPPPRDEPFGTFAIDIVTFWGDGYKVRKLIKKF